MIKTLLETVNLKKTKEELVPGTYTQKSRETWLRELLKVQRVIPWVFAYNIRESQIAVFAVNIYNRCKPY